MKLMTLIIVKIYPFNSCCNFSLIVSFLTSGCTAAVFALQKTLYVFPPFYISKDTVNPGERYFCSKEVKKNFS